MVNDVEENDVQQLEALGETSSPAGRSYDLGGSGSDMSLSTSLKFMIRQ